MQKSLTLIFGTGIRSGPISLPVKMAAAAGPLAADFARLNGAAARGLGAAAGGLGGAAADGLEADPGVVAAAVCVV